MRRIVAGVAAAAAAALPVVAGAEAPADPVFDLSAADLSAPVTIRADALEATEARGVRRLTFERNVEVEQGDLRLRAQSLEALYPAGEKQPSRLSARGSVHVSQGGREARCQRATYERAEARIRCEGDAALREGPDEILGEAIVFDLAARRVRVEGGARVAVTPGDDAALPVPGLEGEGPIRIRADDLEAWETPEGRFLAFGGSVTLRRDDLTLRADRIELVYPPDSQEPDRMVAEGDVVAVRGDQEARCAHAEYRGSERLLECRGDARLQRGVDQVSGDTMLFDLDTERLVISGNTRLLLASRAKREAATP